jgi:hypothetical protein
LLGPEVDVVTLDSTGVVGRVVVGVPDTVGVKVSEVTDVAFRDPVSVAPVGRGVVVELTSVTVGVGVGVDTGESIEVTLVGVPSGVVMTVGVTVGVKVGVAMVVSVPFVESVEVGRGEIEVSVEPGVVVGTEESVVEVVGRTISLVGAVPTKVGVGVSVGASVGLAITLVALSTTLLPEFKMLESIPPRSVVAEVVTDEATGEGVDSAIVPSVGVAVDPRVGETTESVGVAVVVGATSVEATVESVDALVPTALEGGRTPSVVVAAALDSTELVVVGAGVGVGSSAEVIPVTTELRTLPTVGRIPSGVVVVVVDAVAPVPVPVKEIPEVLSEVGVGVASAVVLVGEITPPGPNVIPPPVEVDAAAVGTVSAGVETVVGDTTDVGTPPVDPAAESAGLVSDGAL